MCWITTPSFFSSSKDEHHPSKITAVAEPENLRGLSGETIFVKVLCKPKVPLIAVRFFFLGGGGGHMGNSSFNVKWWRYFRNVNLRSTDWKKEMHFIWVPMYLAWKLIGDTIFYVSYWRQDRHFTLSSEPREGLNACRAKEVPSFLSYFKTLSIGPAPKNEPTTSRSAVKRSTDWPNPAAAKVRTFSHWISSLLLKTVEVICDYDQLIFV